MAMDWHHYLKRYIWDENKTPFFTAVPKLNKAQAKNETFLYAIFISVPASLLVAASLAHTLKNGTDMTILAGIYGLTICIAAALLHVKKYLKAALYSVTAPIVLVGYLFLAGFPENMSLLDQIVLLAVLFLWMRYTVRVASITKNFSNMPDKPTSS